MKGNYGQVIGKTEANQNQRGKKEANQSDNKLKHDSHTEIKTPKLEFKKGHQPRGKGNYTQDVDTRSAKRLGNFALNRSLLITLLQIPPLPLSCAPWINILRSILEFA
jgi:hypothetical protein